jgi:hypothetical protein
MTPQQIEQEAEKRYRYKGGNTLAQQAINQEVIDNNREHFIQGCSYTLEKVFGKCVSRVHYLIKAEIDSINELDGTTGVLRDVKWKLINELTARRDEILMTVFNMNKGEFLKKYLLPTTIPVKENIAGIITDEKLIELGFKQTGLVGNFCKDDFCIWHNYHESGGYPIGFMVSKDLIGIETIKDLEYYYKKDTGKELQ